MVIRGSGECRERNAGFDDVGREHQAGIRTEIERVVRRVWRHQEAIPLVQGQRGLALDAHLDGAGEDVPDLLAGMLVPARLDAGWDLGQNLPDLPTVN